MDFSGGMIFGLVTTHAQGLPNTVMENPETDLESDDGIWEDRGIGKTIAAVRSDLLVRVSGGEIKFRRFLKTLITITLLCPILAVSCHPTLLKRSPSSLGLTHGELDKIDTPEPQYMCFRDEHCARGSFCNDPTKSCVPCLVEECSKWKRLPSTTTNCIKAQEHCGNCLPGYSDHHGHCQPTNDHFFNHGKNQTASSTFPAIAEGGKSQNDFTFLNWGLLGAILGLVLLSISTPVFIYVFSRQRNRPPSKSSLQGQGDREGMMEGEREFQRPPPYNPSMVNHPLAPPFYRDEGSFYHWTSPPPSPHNIQDENPSMAIAFRTGQFPTIQNHPGEGITGGDGQEGEVAQEPSTQMEPRSEPASIPQSLEMEDDGNQDSGLFQGSAGENEGIEVGGQSQDPVPELPLLDLQFLLEVVLYGAEQGQLPQPPLPPAQTQSPPPPPPMPPAQPPVVFHPEWTYTYPDLEFMVLGGETVPPTYEISSSDIDSSDGVVPQITTGNEDLPMDMSFYP